MRRLAVLGLLAIATTARAGDGSLAWKTIESEHFVVHYYEPNGDIGRRVAVVAERAHRVLAPILHHQPEDKTHIVITDDTDGANGYATAIPFNHIGLFATAPDALSVLNDHDDWLYGLVAHEYTHILHLDTISGIPWLYNKVFGKTWAPNNIQPRWFIEGMATYEESRRSSSGRTRNSIFEMFLRVAVLAGRPLRLDEVTSGPYIWPHGTAAYLYGSFFLQYLTDRYGDETLTQISHEYGARPIPYGLHRAVEHVIGKGYDQLYEEWLDFLRRRFELQRDAVQLRGATVPHPLTHTGELNGNPRFLPDGRLVWQQADGKSYPRYLIAGPGGTRELLRFDGGGQFSPLPDGTGLVIQRNQPFRTYYDYGDLWRVDFAKNDGEEPKVTRLTFGLRAAAPDVSPDGQRVAFTMNGRSRQRLAVMPIAAGATPEIVWEGRRWDQAFNPAWSPDGGQLAFSTWTDGGYADIYVWNAGSKAITRVTHDRAIDATPRFSPDGKYLYFCSDRSGIYNVYAWETASGKLWQVTNVLGGAFGPAASPDGKRIVYEGYESDGYELHEIAVDPAGWLAAEPYVDDRPDPTVIPDGEAQVGAARDYDPWETLAPHNYKVTTTVDSYGSAVSVTTGGSDIVGLHGWAAGVTYGLKHGDVGFGLGYSYYKYWPSFGISVGRGTGQSGGLILDARNTQFTSETWGLSAAIGLPVVRRADLFSDLSFSYDLSWLRDLGPPVVQDPNAAVPMLPETGVFAGLTMSWSMSNVRGFVYSLGPVEGRGVALSLRIEDPALASQARSVEVYYRWDEYWRTWGDQVLAFRLGGGIGQTDRRGDIFFGLGGVPRQDIVDAILRSTRAGTSYLHGYPPNAVYGHQFHLLNLEYRVPVAIIEKGLSTLPFYVKRFHVAGLFDAGNAFDGELDPGDLKTAIGVSLRLDMVFGYYVGGSFDLGYARGLSSGGQNEFWLLLTNTL